MCCSAQIGVRAWPRAPKPDTHHGSLHGAAGHCSMASNPRSPRPGRHGSGIKAKLRAPRAGAPASAVSILRARPARVVARPGNLAPPYAGGMTRRRIAVPLVDGFDRRVRDLRISITDRCNLRCSYCMPAEGMAWLPRTEVLTYEEIARVATALCRGVRVRVDPADRRRTAGARARDPAGRDVGAARGRSRPHHQRREAGRGCSRPRPRGPQPRERVARHAPARSLPRADAPGRARARGRRDRRRDRRRVSRR